MTVTMGHTRTTSRPRDARGPHRGAAVAVAAAVALAGCTLTGSGGAEGGGGDGRTAVAALPGEPVSVAAGADPARLALSASAALHESAPVVVLAPSDDLAAQTVAATAAVARQAPLLLVAGEVSGTAATDGSSPEASSQAETSARAETSPAAADDPDALVAELDRLGTDAVLAVGPAAARWAQGRPDLTVTALDVTAGSPGESAARALAGVLGVDVAVGDPVTPAEAPRAVAELDADAPMVPAAVAASPGDASPTSPATSPAPGEAATVATSGEPLPEVETGTRATGVVAVAAADPGAVAAVATARAAGAAVVVAPGGDPRASVEAIETLSTATPETVVVGLGDAVGDLATLTDRVEVARTGVQLPGGGQLTIPMHRYVALYGNVESPALGSMGEQPLQAAIDRVKALAAEYQPYSDEPVVPAFEMITTVASGNPTDDGDYSYGTPEELMTPWLDAAAEQGVYVLIDLQSGRTDFLTQAKQYEDLLMRPNVGLALDPEWRLGPDERPLRQIGSVDAAEINATSQWLADLVAANDLPQKIFMVHQFKLSMIRDRETLVTDHDELAFSIHADGFGAPGVKFDTWRAVRADAPEGIWWAWKNFIDEDSPTLTPQQTYEIEPKPWIVTYQ